MRSNITEKSVTESVSYIDRASLLSLLGVFLQWIFIYQYFCFNPTVFAEGTEYSAILNLAIVVCYQLIAYSAIVIFRGEISNKVFLSLPIISLLVYESYVFSYIIYAIEFVRYGELSFENAQDRLIDKQNIISSFLSMLVMVGGVLAIMNRASVARKVGLACVGVIVLGLIVYHVNLFFFQFKPLSDEMKEWQKTEMLDISVSRDLEATCKGYDGLECYRFYDGDPWPEKAKLAGSDVFSSLKADYKNGWKKLKEDAKEGGQEAPVVWTYFLHDSSFDETFAPQFDILIVFTKQGDQNTLIVQRKLITYIFQILERMSLNIAILFMVWQALAHLIIKSHPIRESKISIKKYLLLWVVSGTVLSAFYFNIYLHVMLLGVGLALLYRRYLKPLFIGGFIYALIMFQVFTSLMLIDGNISDDITLLIACVSAVITMGSMAFTLRYARSNWKAYSVLILIAGSSMIVPALNTSIAVDGTPFSSIAFFVTALVFLQASKTNKFYLLSGVFCLMAGIMTLVMSFWFVPGLWEDSIVERRYQDMDTQINMPLVTSYFIYMYFAIVMGLLFNHLNKVHYPIFKKINEQSIK